MVTSLATPPSLATTTDSVDLGRLENALHQHVVSHERAVHRGPAAAAHNGRRSVAEDDGILSGVAAKTKVAPVRMAFFGVGVNAVHGYVLGYMQKPRSSSLSANSSHS